MLSLGCSLSLDPRLVGDPVDTLSGAVFDGKLEFRLTGPIELWWWRHYDSAQCHRHYSLGWGHAHDFERYLRFDVDGIVYEGPLGRTVGFSPLQSDGDEGASQGYRIRRISATRYRLFRSHQPAMEFDFHRDDEPARLKRLFEGRHEIVFEYDHRHRLRRIVDSARRHIHVSDDQAGRLTRLELARNYGEPGVLLLAYRYDNRGRAIAATHASGHGYEFDYDDSNRMVRRTGRKGFRFHFDYDGAGRCIKAVGDDRLYEVALEYTLPGRVTRVTRADGGVWTYFFDEAAALTQIHDPLGGIEQFVRDEYGRLTTRIDPTGNATRLSFDAYGAPQYEVDSRGLRSAVPRDPNAPDPLQPRVASNAAEYELGRLLKVGDIVPPDAKELQALRLPAVIGRLAMLRVVDDRREVLPSPDVVRPLGPLWWPEPARGRVFNEFGKLVAQRDDFGRTRRWSYDAAGNIDRFTDFDGQHWVHDYGTWHFLRELRGPSGATVRFAYTPQGEIATFTDALGASSEFTYDAKDQLAEIRRHGVVRDRYTRDVSGNLVAKHAADGRELLRIEIGAGNLPIRKVLSSGDEHTFSYDDKGRVTRSNTNNDATEAAYDLLGNCIREARNGLGHVTTYSGFRRPVDVTLFGRFVIRYERRAGGILAITDPGGRVQQIRLMPNGFVERQFSNGSSEVAQYDGMGRCHFKAATRASGEVWQRRYEWSGEGELRTSEDSFEGAVTYEYDDMHRLRRRSGAGKTAVYEVDAANNVLRQPGLDNVELAQGNRLIGANGFRFHYNDRNHVETQETADGLVRYFYDSRDQLVGVETPHGHWRAEYDALGRRTRKTFGGETTEYFWSGEQLVAEIGPRAQCRLYIYLDPLALTPLLFVDYSSIGAEPSTGTRGFVFSDQLGRPRWVEDDQGALVWRASHEPYGQSAVAPGSRVEFEFRFPGHYYDGELGLHYNRFRYYDPVLARYLQSDPWGIAGGFNLYSYPANPLGVVDVRGLGEENGKTGKRCDDEEGSARAQARADGHDGLGVHELPPLQGKTPGEIRQILREAGYTMVQRGDARNRSEIWIYNDGAVTHAVRIDPNGHPNNTPNAKAGDVPHVHKETVPTSMEGDYRTRYVPEATTHNDQGVEVPRPGPSDSAQTWDNWAKQTHIPAKK